MRITRYVLLGPVWAALAVGQTNPASIAARQWREQHERAIVDEFVALLAIPNISSDRANILRNAESIVQMMAKRGVAAKLMSVPGSNPVVFGEIKTPGATRTIGFYAHYDGQPLDPKEWASPPWAPHIGLGAPNISPAAPYLRGRAPNIRPAPRYVATSQSRSGNGSKRRRLR